MQKENSNFVSTKWKMLGCGWLHAYAYKQAGYRSYHLDVKAS